MTTSPTTIKEIISKVSVRTNCNSSCPIWPCVLQPSVNKDTMKCALHLESDKSKQTFARIFLDKEHGLNTLLLENAFILAKIRDQGANLHELIQLNESLINIKKSIYGTKQTITHLKTSDRIYNSMQSIAIEADYVPEEDETTSE